MDCIIEQVFSFYFYAIHLPPAEEGEFLLYYVKNILFPKIYMPWEQNDLDNVSSAELQELITLIDARLAELDKEEQCNEA